MKKRVFEKPDREREDVMALVEGRGLRVAVEAAISVCEDPEAAAPAKATASGLLMRAGGLGGFAKNWQPPKRNSPLDDLDDDEMSEVRQSLLRQMEDELERMQAGLPADDEDEGSAFA